MITNAGSRNLVAVAQVLVVDLVVAVDSDVFGLGEVVNS